MTAIGASGQKFRLNNRLDIYDVKLRRWLEAVVVDLKEESGHVKTIKVHFRSYNASYDEWIDCAKEAVRIKEVGSFSGAEGAAKYNVRIQQELHENKENLGARLNALAPPRVLDGSGWGLKTQPKQEFDMSQIDWRREERKFREDLKSKNLQILEVGTDGNCLFRAIAHQAYGDED